MPSSIAGFLTGHPARKFVIDFLRMIVVDSLSQPVPSKSNTTVIDIMLDVSGLPDPPPPIPPYFLAPTHLQFVIDFLRMIVVDSLSQPVPSKSNTTVIDIMLDVSGLPDPPPPHPPLFPGPHPSTICDRFPQDDSRGQSVSTSSL